MTTLYFANKKDAQEYIDNIDMPKNAKKPIINTAYIMSGLEIYVLGNHNDKCRCGTCKTYRDIDFDLLPGYEAKTLSHDQVHGSI